MDRKLIRPPRVRRLADTTQYLWIRAKRLVRRLAMQKATTRQIAWGGALGAFIAFTPTFGFQMVLAFAAATALKCSRFSALVLTYITNPFTVVPVYMFTYRTGAWILRVRPLTRQMHQVLTRLEGEGGWAALQELLRFGWQIMLPLWVGGLAVGLVGAAIAFPLLLRLVEGHRHVAALKREKRALRQRGRLVMAAGMAASGDPDEKDTGMLQEALPEAEPSLDAKDDAIEVDAQELS